MNAPSVAVASLAALAAAARRSGKVVEGGGEPPSPALPDAELLALCKEIAGADRIADAERAADIHPWEQPVAFKALGDRLHEACRDKARLMPRAIELHATTPAGVLAKAELVAELFQNARGQRAAAVRALVEDLARVLAAGGGQ